MQRKYTYLYTYPGYSKKAYNFLKTYSQVNLQKMPIKLKVFQTLTTKESCKPRLKNILKYCSF